MLSRSICQTLLGIGDRKQERQEISDSWWLNNSLIKAKYRLRLLSKVHWSFFYFPYSYFLCSYLRFNHSWLLIRIGTGWLQAFHCLLAWDTCSTFDAGSTFSAWCWRLSFSAFLVAHLNLWLSNDFFNCRKCLYLGVYWSWLNMRLGFNIPCVDLDVDYFKIFLFFFRTSLLDLRSKSFRLFWSDRKFW